MDDQSANRKMDDQSANRKLSKVALLAITIMPVGQTARSEIFQTVADIEFCLFMMIFASMLVQLPVVLVLAITGNGLSGAFPRRSLAYAVPGICDTMGLSFFFSGLRTTGGPVALVLLNVSMLSTLLIEPCFTRKVPRLWQVLSTITTMLLAFAFVMLSQEGGQDTGTSLWGEMLVMAASVCWGLEVSFNEFLVDYFERTAGVNPLKEIRILSLHSCLWCSMSLLAAAVILDWDFAVEYGLLHGFDNPMFLGVCAVGGLVNLQTKFTSGLFGAMPFLFAGTLAPGLAYLAEVILGLTSFEVVTFVVLISLVGTVMNYTVTLLELRHAHLSTQAHFSLIPGEKLGPSHDSIEMQEVVAPPV